MRLVGIGWKEVLLLKRPSPGKPRVKLAWAFSGYPSSVRAWCIDDVKVFTIPSSAYDLTPEEMVWPLDKIVPNNSQNIWFRVKNYGIPMARGIRIGATVRNSTYEILLESLPAHTDTLIKMRVPILDTGMCPIKIFTSHFGDSFPENDTLTDTLEVRHSFWEIVSQYPLGITKGSASLAKKENSDSIYFWGGNKERLFYKYFPRSNQWDTLACLPKRYREGFLVGTDGSQIYLLTSDRRLCVYDITRNRWDTFPQPKMSGPTACWDKRGNYIYCLNGISPHFRRYHIPTRTWDTLPFPYRVHPGGRTRGMGIACDDSGNVYIMATLLQGRRRDKRFLRYKPSSQRFDTLSSLPLPDTNLRESVREMAYADNRIYVLRDGGYSRRGEVWVYEINQDRWFRITAEPPFGVVRRGATLTLWKDGNVHYGFAFPGINTRIFKIYPPPILSGGFLSENREAEEGELEVEDSGGLLGDGNKEAEYYKPRFSPNSDTIVCYKKDTSGFCHLSKISVSSDREITITTGEFDYENPSYSGAGEWIVAIKDDKVVKMRSDGSEEQILTTGICDDPVVSADGNWVFYSKWVNPYHQIYKVSINGGEEIPLTPAGINCFSPDVSPDNREIVYEKFVDYYLRIALLSLETGEERELTSGGFHSCQPRFSPDGEWIVFERINQDGGSQICKVSRDGQNLVTLTPGEGHYEDPSFSPDGEWVACVKWFDEGSAICKLNAETGEEVILTDTVTAKDNPVYSPEGNYIAYENKGSEKDEGGSGICVIPLNPGAEREADLEKSPLSLALYPNSPNPFRRRAAIRYALPEPSFVRLLVYDIKGGVVRILVNEEQKPGFYEVIWDGEDEKGERVSAGIYFYRLETKKRSLTKKMIKSK